jgi:co-chaperonin GroES (HSP10)
MVVAIQQQDAEGRRVPFDVEAGDLIVFGKYTGYEITLDDARRPHPELSTRE